MNRIDYKEMINRAKAFEGRKYTLLYIDNSDDIVYKVFDYYFLIDMLDADYDLEELVLEGSKLVKTPGIIIPNGIIYEDKSFVGYSMPYFEGTSIYRFPYHPARFFEMYSNVEKVVKEADNIVFPDLLTSGNILVNKDYEVKLIDYDGFQISDYLTPVFSKFMGEKSIYDNTKYKIDNKYTKQLDIKSLTYLFMNLFFNVDICYLDRYTGNAQKRQINDLISDLDIDNDELVRKIFALYSDNVENEYLGDTAKYICDNYESTLVYSDSGCPKTLVKKKDR